MEKIVNSGRYSQSELLQIHRYKKYLHVIFMSNITDAAGVRLRTDVLFGQRPSAVDSKCKWPNQQKPPYYARKLLKEAILECCVESETEYLRYPLGIWRRESHMPTGWILHEISNRGFQVLPDGSYLEYPHTPSVTRANNTYSAQSINYEVPNGCKQVTVTKESQTQVMKTGIIDIIPKIINDTNLLAHGRVCFFLFFVVRWE